MLKTVDAIIDALGGSSAAALLMGVGPSAVSMWRARGAIPSEYYLAVSEALKPLRKRPDPRVFKFRAAG